MEMLDVRITEVEEQIMRKEERLPQNPGQPFNYLILIILKY